MGIWQGRIRFFRSGNAIQNCRMWVSGKGEFGLLGSGMQYRIVEYGFLAGENSVFRLGNAIQNCRIWVSGRGEFVFLGRGMQYRIVEYGYLAGGNSVYWVRECNTEL